ncbi:UPF0481 protein At3g47200-like [Phragmites australis]|uniref:UPF0481 protein At3g47200-like n=1 Tax=Phragmites australis TaxID=29695 RepID=UPI002D797C36|nr:UPF0481 protein At3g47200-like [Phragmites australis]
MDAGLLPPHQRDLSFRLSSSNAWFRSAQQPHSRPVIIQKVPQSVRGGLEERYFVPDVVSIGPYHHGVSHLVEMQQIKEAVVHDFCRSAVGVAGQAANLTVDPFLEAVRPLVPEARLCYADRFDSITDNDFVNMMVVDGCFLLAVVAILTGNYNGEHWPWTRGRLLRIMKDILLFENQIPWLVVRALMALLQRVQVDEFVSKILAYFDVHGREPARFGTPWDMLSPVHLLDLVHQRHLGGTAPAADHDILISNCDYARAFAHFTSAVELAEAGIRIHGRDTCRVADVSVEPATVPAALLLRIGRLALPQLALSWLPRCWLINMVALECVADRSDGQSGVSSYLAILGSLIRAERDVEELRARKILFSTMSDRRTVEFFDVLLDPLPRQELYLRTLEDIVQLRTTRSARSSIHSVFYRNRRIILTVAPLLSLLVAIIGVVVNNSIKHK